MTAQLPDTILLNGAPHSLFSTPLAAWLKASPWEFVASHSACWRGYRATWTIEQEGLWLTDFSGKAKTLPPGHVPQPAEAPSTIEHQGNTTLVHRVGGMTNVVQPASLHITLRDLFPHTDGRGVFADWFSGELRIPQGKLLNYVHSGYASEYEQTILYEIQNGHVRQHSVVTNRPEPM